MTKNGRLEDNEINENAENLSKKLINFENNLWKKNNGIWTNTTGEATSRELSDAIRNQVKLHLPEAIALNDIDKVKKELTTILTGRKYSLTQITPAFRFADIKYTWDGKLNNYVPSQDVDFSPFQLRRAIPKKDVKREEVPELARYLDNLTGNDQAKEDALFEWFGYVLAGEHSGVSLIIEGQTGVGKSTIAKIANVAMAAKDDDSIMLNLQSDDVYTTKGDQFAFANGVEKALWVVGEGSNVFQEQAIKKFNDLVDESKNTFPVRKMNQAPKNAPKFWNMLMLTNGGFTAHGNAETMKAFKKRLLIIESPAKKGILTMEEYKELFNDKSINYFIQEALKGYLLTKQTLKPRVAKFTQTKVINFWNDQEDNYLCEKMILEHAHFKVGWISNKSTYFKNEDIEDMINEYRKAHPSVSIKYKIPTFKNEMMRMFDSGLLQDIKSMSKTHQVREGNDRFRPLSFEWK